MPLPQSIKQEIPLWVVGFYHLVKAHPERYACLNSCLKEVPPNADVRSIGNALSGLKGSAFWYPDVRSELVDATNQFVKMAYQATTQTHSAREGMKEYFDRGYCVLPQLSDSKIKAMREYFLENPVLGEDNQSTQSVEQAKAVGRNVAEFSSGTLLNSPHYLEFISEPEVVERVTAYLGAIPTAIIATAWWSFAGREVPKEAQLYHYDDADWKFCNYFVYLTDVDEDSGPHAYIAGSHRPDFVKEKLEREPDDNELARLFKWYMQQMRKSDDEVRKYLGVEPTIFTGPAGTNFLADTRAIHKGIVPTKKDRLICQVTYALAPALQQDLDVIPLSDVQKKFPQIAPRFQTDPNKYTFRYLVTSGGLQ